MGASTGGLSQGRATSGEPHYVSKSALIQQRELQEFTREEYLHIILKQGGVLRIAHMHTVGADCQIEMHTHLLSTTMGVVCTAVDNVRAHDQKMPDRNKDTLGGGKRLSLRPHRGPYIGSGPQVDMRALLESKVHREKCCA